MRSVCNQPIPPCRSTSYWSQTLTYWVLLSLFCIIQAEKSIRDTENILPNMECHSQWNRNDSVKYYTGSIHGLDIQWALQTDIRLVLFQGKTNRQTDKQTIWSWWFIDYQEAHRACVASVFWSASLLARQQAAGSHQDIHLILQNSHTVKKVERWFSALLPFF